MDRVQVLISSWLGPLRGRLMIAFVLIVGMYFVLAFGEQAWRARELEASVAERQAEITELENKRDNLEQQLADYNTGQYDTYVAQIARRDLSLAYPGETVMLVRWSEAHSEPEIDDSDPEPPEPDPTWQRWVDYLTRSG
ncbi:MAG: septum formation initiator family protein [Thermomicrobiaceae bacterium]